MSKIVRITPPIAHISDGREILLKDIEGSPFVGRFVVQDGDKYKLSGAPPSECET